jgi:hypothetical protein
MRRLIGSLTVLVLVCSVVPAADPTPDDAMKLLQSLKAKLRPKGKKSEAILSVDIAHKKISDDDVKTIAALKSIKELYLTGVVLKEMGEKIIYAPKQIGDEGVKHLADLTELQKLSLEGTHVSDEGLKSLAKLSKLETLNLSDTKVTDEGMKELTKLPKLQTVMLYNTKVTDAGVGVLKRWKSEISVKK